MDQSTFTSSFCKQRHWGPLHTETFSCVFVLFTVLKGDREQSAHYLKQYKNAGKRFRVYGAWEREMSAALWNNLLVNFAKLKTINYQSNANGLRGYFRNL